MNALELFAGAGGLALGVSRAGFAHSAVVEWDKAACDSMRENKSLGREHFSDWPIIEADVRDLHFSDFGQDIDLLAGGVPCQPWSLGGKHAGQNDARNLFPEMMRAVRETQPKAVLVENVKGLLRESFATYFEYITLGLSYPDVEPKQGEDWPRHLKRLEKHHSSGSDMGLQYKTTFRLLNAADYGVPQRRERVFIVAFRADLASQWSFPEPTHSAQALAYSQWASQEYWERHEVSTRKRPAPSPRQLGVLKGADLFSVNRAPWLTVRDALRGLPEPDQRGDRAWRNHVLVPGARSYPGHTGSPLDEPAKTLKAGDHGVPGGENTLCLPDGSIRYFTVREAARLQTFPDDYGFPVSWTESMRQLGNAVPVRIAQILAQNIGKHIFMQHAKTGQARHAQAKAV